MQIDELVVEPGREEHIARHHVTLDEVEEVVYGRHDDDHLYDNHYRVVGRTDAGQFLTVIVAQRRRNVYALITARDANQVERRSYRRRMRE